MLRLKGKIMIPERLIKQTIRSARATLLVFAVYGGIYTTAGLVLGHSYQAPCAFIGAITFFLLDVLIDGIWSN